MSFSVYIAKIEGVASTEDTRLQVRIVPEMEKIEKDFLPIWPCFFKHQAFTGAVGSYVWCIASTDFTTGYVLGYANNFTWGSSYAESSIPLAMLDRIDDLHVELRGQLLNFKDIIVTFWNETSLHFVDRVTGSHLVAFTSGTISFIRPTEITLAVGAKSLLSMNSEEIVLTAPVIRLAGEVRLGLNPTGKVMTSPGALGGNSLPAAGIWA